MYIIVNNQTLVLGDHIEIDHEREIPWYLTFEELEKIHNDMHRIINDWDHRH